jgi:SAM-dependent methyltransferase
MPTISSRPEREPHQHRAVAEAFGSDAERYNRTRPGYPPALIDRIVTTEGLEIVDVGSGTGLLARPLRAAGARVLGVDPDARMADFLRRSGIETEVATFEAWAACDRMFDAVVAAQSWHWVDPVAGAAKAALVLRPGGRLAVLWNAFEFPAGMGEAVEAVFRRAMPDSPPERRIAPGPDGYLKLCEKAADGMRQSGAFDEPQTWRYDWSRPYTRDEWLDQVPTFGGFSFFPPATQEWILADLGAIIDSLGGSFTMRFATVVSTATAKP